MKKITNLLILAALVVSILLPGFSFADDIKPMTKVKLDILTVDAPYKKSDIDIVYDKTNYSTTATLYKKGTKEKLVSYSEKIDNTPVIRSGNTFIRTLEASFNVKPASVLVSARVEIWSGGSFRQINSCSKVWQKEGSSGSYKIERDAAYLNTKKFPTMRLSINATGAVVVQSTNSVGASFSYTSLKGFGFSMEGKSTGTWYARKNYNEDVGISIDR